AAAEWRRRDVADAVKIDELDGIAVGILEVKVPPGKAAVAHVFIQQHLDAVGFQMRHRGVEILALYEKGVMHENVPALVGRDVIVAAAAREHKILLAAAHEN